MKKTKLLLAVLMYGLNILSPCFAQYNVGNDDGFAYSSVGSIGNEVALSLANLSVDLGNDTTLCAGNLLDAGNSGATYLWQDNSTNQTLAVTTSGTYFVQVTDSNSNTASDTIEVTVNPLPSVDLGNDIALCTAMDTVLDAGSGYTSYLWSTNETTQTISISSANTYSVKVTDSNGCSNSDAIIVTTKICTDINDQQQASSTQFQVYPNPSDGDFELKILNSKSGINNAVIKIYDVLGREIYKSEITNQSFKIQNLKSKIDKGVYFLQLATEEGMWNEKIIINY